MTHSLLNSVAATTMHRDRDELDRAVAELLRQFLETHSITLLRIVTDGHIKRVAQRVRLSGQGAREAAAPVSELSDLPPLSDFPFWHECVLLGKVVSYAGAQGQSFTVIPAGGEPEVVAILVIETPAPLSPREADLVAGILAIVRNHLALLDYGERDTLTGLLNRKTFESHFEKLRQRMAHPPEPAAGQHSLDESPPGAEPSWLALIDIDHFKSINDGYGHLFGDEVLLLLSRLMQRSFRGADQLFRFGGEEFVVILEHASEPGARIVLQRLRAAIEEHRFPQVGRITISVGYTRICFDDVPTLCVERADAALYYAKNQGRNSVCNFETLVATGAIKSKLNNGHVELF